ncbi:unnamed protein product [Cylicostephanus goldi]|uniref:Uncharacterized protein n=1 Tax=Cylicostephanus goldi TaxID=71465 RepID=A0A3P6RHU2_CYLGO|nr:unnamed protein product [Cylicostephanus goldi]
MINVDVLRIFVHAHFYTYSTIHDISLRTSSATNLRSLIEHLAKCPYDDKLKTDLLNVDLIQTLSQGLRSEVDVVREESVRCITSLVDHFPNHTHLSQLLQLRNSDEDLDFFSNIIHIQVSLQYDSIVLYRPSILACFSQWRWHEIHVSGTVFSTSKPNLGSFSPH